MGSPGIILMRSPSGYGKSTFVKNITSDIDGLTQYRIFSADYYFTDNGIYKFDPTKLGEAHSHCLRGYLNFISYMFHNRRHQKSFCIVDNTNINIEDIAPYFAVAQAYDLDVKIVQMPHIDVEEAFRRNIHGVPLKTIQVMEQNLKRPLPKRLNECLVQL